MKLWYIWGLNLPVLVIEADTFDKALEEARKTNPNYDTGKLKCVIPELYTTLHKYTDPLSDPIISAIRSKRI